MKKSSKIVILTAFLLFFSSRSVHSEGGYVINVGTSPVLSSSGIFIAKEKGYFDELGLNVEITTFRSSGVPMTVLLANGELDVGGGNLSSGLWNAINQGLDIRLVADKGHIEKDHSYIALLVRRDHIESGRYKSFSDLKGFKMGLTTLGGYPSRLRPRDFCAKVD